MNFVKLTTWKDLGDTYINIDNVTEVLLHRDGGTIIFFCAGGKHGTDHSLVKETPAEIMGKL